MGMLNFERIVILLVVLNYPCYGYDDFLKNGNLVLLNNSTNGNSNIYKNGNCDGSIGLSYLWK